MTVRHKNQFSLVLGLSRIGLFLGGLILLGCGLVIVGLGIYLWLVEPRRLAVRCNPEAQTVEIINPQPLKVSSAKDVRMLELPAEAFLTEAATHTAIWANGNSFQSGRQAGWALVKDAWPLWSACAGAFIGIGLLTRCCRRLECPPNDANRNSEPLDPAGRV